MKTMKKLNWISAILLFGIGVTATSRADDRSLYCTCDYTASTTYELNRRVNDRVVRTLEYYSTRKECEADLGGKYSPDGLLGYLCSEDDSEQSDVENTLETQSKRIDQSLEADNNDAKWRCIYFAKVCKDSDYNPSRCDDSSNYFLDYPNGSFMTFGKVQSKAILRGQSQCELYISSRQTNRTHYRCDFQKCDRI